LLRVAVSLLTLWLFAILIASLARFAAFWTTRAFPLLTIPFLCVVSWGGFALLDLFSQLVRIARDALLIVGQLLGIISAVGARFHATLEADELVDILQVAEHSFAFRLELPVAILLEQEFE
jgi:hypothetical protein